MQACDDGVGGGVWPGGVEAILAVVRGTWESARLSNVKLLEVNASEAADSDDEFSRG